MTTPRKLAVAGLAVLTLGVAYLTSVEWLLAGIGSAMDTGEPTGPMNGYLGVVGGAVVTLVLVLLTVLAAIRGCRTAHAAGSTL